MKIGYIIICRFNSSRLPGKILRHINGKPILQYIYEKLLKVTTGNNIVVATSTEKSDDPIVAFCTRNNINCYRGNLNNVAGRFLSCAKEFDFDYATRINGDNLFADIGIIKEMQKIAASEAYNFISNVKNRTFPKGISVEMVKTEYYSTVYKKFCKPEHFEHVTLWLYENQENNYFHYYNKQFPEARGVQLALDTENDFALASRIFNSFDKDHTVYGFQDIIRIREELLD